LGVEGDGAGKGAVGEQSPLKVSLADSRVIAGEATDSDERCVCDGVGPCRRKLCCGFTCCTWTLVVITAFIGAINFAKLPYYWPTVPYMTNVTYDAEFCSQFEPATQQCRGLEASPWLKWFMGNSWHGSKLGSDPYNFVAPHAAMGVSLEVLLVAQMVDHQPPGTRFVVFQCLTFIFYVFIIPEASRGLDATIPNNVLGFNFNAWLIGIGLFWVAVAFAAWWLIAKPEEAARLAVRARAVLDRCTTSGSGDMPAPSLEAPARLGRRLLWHSWAWQGVTINLGPLAEWLGIFGQALGVSVGSGDEPSYPSGHDWYSSWGNGWAGWLITFLVLLPTAAYIAFLCLRDWLSPRCRPTLLP